MYAWPGAIRVLAYMQPQNRPQSVGSRLLLQAPMTLQDSVPVGSVVQTQNELTNDFATTSFWRVKRRISCIIWK